MPEVDGAQIRHASAAAADVDVRSAGNKLVTALVIIISTATRENLLAPLIEQVELTCQARRARCSRGPGTLPAGDDPAGQDDDFDDDFDDSAAAHRSWGVGLPLHRNPIW